MRRLAGLLRAVNVGGRKLLSADLKRAAETVGFARPQTLLASGNVVFETDLPAAEAAARLEARILKDLGLAADVMARDLADLDGVIAANPFERQAQEEPSRLMAMFLSGELQGGVELLEPACAFGEQVRAGPGCLYVWFPAGAGTSKLSNVLIERRLKVRGTMRNWNTVGKLRELVAG